MTLSDSAVERMGLHGLDPDGPEFHGKPFSYGFRYGYHAGRLIFFEPMISPLRRPESGPVAASHPP